MTRGRAAKGPAPRFPFAPLVHLAEMRRGEGTLNDTQLAEYLGICRGNVYHYRLHGITLDVADRLAIDLGLHPLLIWTDWDEVLLAYDGPFEEPELFEEVVA
jgi:hypothetical protein